MNRELFRSMQSQLRPGAEARAALAEELAKKKTVPVGRYVAAAACAAVLVAAVPVYSAVRNHLRWQAVVDNFQIGGTASKVEITKPHSYVLSSGAVFWTEDASAPESNSAATGGAGDQDAGMTPGELTDDIFFGPIQVGPIQTEEPAVNTGEAEMPGGAAIGGASDQGEAVMAYQNLMARFEADYGPGRCPEWYGGAYIDVYGGLVVNIVASYEEQLTDKALYFRIMDWAGSDRISFGSSPLSLNRLRELQDRTVAAMGELGLPMGCGVNEETGQVELTLPEVTEEALWRLAELDPADTAILVIVGQTPVVDLAEESAPGVTADGGAAGYKPQG